MEATLQSIFRAGFTAYQQRHGLSMDQYQAAQAIMECQTEALGYETWGCPEDGHGARCVPNSPPLRQSHAGSTLCLSFYVS